MSEDPEQEKILKLLLQLGDLQKLGSVALLELARSARFVKLKRGQSLSVDKDRVLHSYLVEGKVQVFSDDKLMQTLEAGSERALLPIFRVHTRGLVARCVTPVTLLYLDESIANRYISSKPGSKQTGIDVVEYDESNQEPSIIDEIRHIFPEREVDLPSLPEVVLRINKVINQSNASLQLITREVQTDPLIAARVLQVANSALYGNSIHHTNIQNAIQSIGIRALQMIVMSVLMQNLFTPTSPVIHRRTQKWYLHSIRVGAVARTLARHIGGFDPDRALLAGLLHEIGVLPLLIQAENRANLFEEPEQLEKVLSELSDYVGGLLLRQWDFDDELILVAEQAHDWHRKVSKADYCDLVQLAQMHCHLVGGKKIIAPPMHELFAFERLQLQKIDPIEVIEEAREEINELIRLLTL